MRDKPSLTVEIDGKKLTVPRHSYVERKTKQLREFGYTNLTEADVESQIDALLSGKTLENGLTVIGMMMEGEVQRE